MIHSSIRPSANGAAPVPPAASVAASGAPLNDEEEAMAEEAVVALVVGAAASTFHMPACLTESSGVVGFWGCCCVL